MSGFWSKLSDNGLQQGDWLSDCHIPEFGPDFSGEREFYDVPVATEDLIIVTQSCDLSQQKVTHVALCPIHGVKTFEERNPKFAKKGQWDQVRKGRVEGLHLLASPTHPEESRRSFVVDFGHIISLPILYLEQHARALGDRWRLQSPYLEHFSQAFARFFMRVGLPSAIPPFD